MTPLPRIGQRVLVFVAGAEVLVLEILGTRLIAPLFGATVYVWSALITVTLAALAAGYAAGGWLADRRPPLRALGQVLLAAGAWLLLLPLGRAPLLVAAAHLGVAGGSLAAAAALLGFPLACLGAVVPLCVRLRAQELARVGRDVGSVSAVSTLGSVAGALLAGYLLIPRLGITVLLAAMAVVLLVAAAICLLRAGARPGAIVALVAAASAAGLSARASLAAPRPGVVHHERTFYGDVEVVDVPLKHRRTLFIDGAAHAGVDTRTFESAAEYVRAFELLAFLRPDGRRALLIGLGGGTLSRRLASYDIASDVVEVDPAVDRAARAQLGFTPTGAVIIDDGRRFLARETRSWDFVVVDAFAGDQHPFHLFSREAFQAMDARLAPDGVLALNVVGYARGPEAGLERAVAQTLRAVFPHVRAMVVNRAADLDRDPVNLLFLASRAPLDTRRDPLAGAPGFSEYYQAIANQVLPDQPGGELITDDHNPIELLAAPAMLAVRRHRLEAGAQPSFD